MKDDFFNGKPRTLALITAVILLVSGISFAGASEHSPDLTGVRLLDSGGADLAGRTVEADAAIGLEYTYGEALDSNPATDISSSYDEEIPVEVPPEIDLTNAVFHGADGTVTGSHKALVRVSRTGGTFRIDAGFDRAEATGGGDVDLRFPLTEHDVTITVGIVPAAVLYDVAPVPRFDELVTGIKIYQGDPENGGKLLTGSATPPTVSGDTVLFIEYEFAVVSGQVTPGTQYEVSCPEGLLWNGSNSEKPLYGKIKTNDQQTIIRQYGTLHINTGNDSKKVAVSFASDFNAEGDEKFGGNLNDGYVYVYSGPDPDQADENGKLDVKWNGTVVLTVYVDEKVPKAAKLDKKGVLSDGQFLWTIHYKAGKKEPVPDSIIDRFDATNQSYVPGSFTVNGSVVGDPSWEADGDYRKMAYSLTNPNTDDVTITYKTTPTDNAFKKENDVAVSNEAWLAKSGAELTDSKASGSAVLGKGDKAWVKKSGVYDSSQKCIHWTVTINTFGRNITDLKMVDDLPEGALLPGSVEVASYASVTPISSSGIGHNGGPKFEIEIPKNAGGKYDDVYTVSYDTRIDPDYYDGSRPDRNFPNDVALSFHWYPLGGGAEYPAISPGDGDEPYVTTNMIQKTGSYNRSTHQITWRIVVNPYGVNLAGYTVTVDDPLEKQAYVGPDGSYPAGVTCDDADLRHPVFTVTNIGSSAVEFSFVTELTDAEDYAYNNPGRGFIKNYRNTVHMKAVGSDGATVESDAQGNVDVVSQVVSKTGKAYDCGKKEITWEVAVNQNRMPMEEVVLEDALPMGLSYVENSLEIDGAAATPDNTSPLIISLGSISDEKTVVFSTKVDTDKFPAFKDSSQVKISNEITLRRKDCHDITVDGAHTIANKALDKSGVYQNAGAGASIAYTVKLNPQSLTFLGSEVLTDTLPLGLELDVQSVKLCRASVDAAGTGFRPGDQVKLVKGANFSYKDDGSEFSILMPPGKSPYLLTYTADLNGKANGPFTNEIKFDGFGGNIGSSSAAGIGGGGGGGISYKPKGTIKIRKTDENGNPVSGAAFALGQDIRTTGSDGIAAFTRVAVGKHDLTETPPPGYVLDPEQAVNLQDIEVKKDEVTEVSVINRKLPSNSSSNGGSSGGGSGGSSGGGSSGGGMLTPPSQPGKAPENGESAQPPDGETITETTPPDTPKDGVIEAPRDSHFVLTAPPKSGTVVVNGDGTWNYTPVSGFRGTDSFVVEVREPGGKKRPVNVLVTIDDPLVPKGVPNTGGGRTTR